VDSLLGAAQAAPNCLIVRKQRLIAHARGSYHASSQRNLRIIGTLGRRAPVIRRVATGLGDRMSGRGSAVHVKLRVIRGRDDPRMSLAIHSFRIASDGIPNRLMI
jgi:asparagine synthetase A